MTENDDTKKFEQVVQKIDPRNQLLRSWVLEGGVSARVTALEMLLPDGQAKKVIVRQHGEADRRENPHIAADEFRLLSILKAAGLAAPAPYLFDETNEIFATPYIVMDYIEGQTEFAPPDLADFLRQSAAHLARIHAIDASVYDLSFLPQQDKIYADKLSQRPIKMDESLDEGHIRDVLEAAWPFVRRNPIGLLHGDYWPGNLLWKDGQLVGVIDWEDARVGDPLSDVAIMRLEILWTFGVKAMQDFTQAYQSLTTFDFTDQPYWDLCVALRPMFKIPMWAGGDVAREKAMRESHHRFIQQAFEKLSI